MDRAEEKAGREEIDKNGRIIIVTGQAEATNLAPQSAVNEWDTL